MANNLIPKHKSDIETMERLKKASFAEINENIDELLVWLQDYNWPIAKEIGPFLSSYTNQIADAIAKVLHGNDNTWKYWCIQELILRSKSSHLSDVLIRELDRLIKSPTDGEKEEELDVISREAMNKFFL